MKKTLVIVSFIACLSLILTACGNSKSSQSSNATMNKTTNSNSSNGTGTEKNNTSTSSNSGTSSSTTNSSSKDNPNDPLTVLHRMDAVIQATLDVESKNKNTKVDYKLKTMTQNGKKVTFSISPAANNQIDFKKGAIKGLIYDGNNSHDVTLYNYVIDSSNKLTLLDPKSNKVVYTTFVTNQLDGSNTNGNN